MQVCKYHWQNFDEPSTLDAASPQRGFSALPGAVASADAEFTPLLGGRLQAAAPAAPPSPAMEDLAAEFERGRSLAAQELSAQLSQAQSLAGERQLLISALSQKIAGQEAVSTAVASRLLSELLAAAKQGSLKTDPLAWRQAYEAIVDAAQLKGSIRVKANPLQLAEVQAALKAEPSLGGMEIEADDALPAGEIHVGDGSQQWMATMDDLFATLSALLVSA